MSRSEPEDLSTRSFRFSCDVYDYCEDLVRLRGLPCRVAHQLFDAAGSIGANRAESQSSYSDKEFAAKNAICLKESREYLLQESNELVSLYAAIVRRLKGR